MKTILFHVALTAFGALPLTNVNAVTTPVAAQTKTTVVQTKNKQSQVNKESAQPTTQPLATAASNTTTAATKPAFNPNDSSTWPTCAANQVVWASDGQCHDKAVVAASAPVATYSAPVTSGSHEDWMSEAGIAASDYTYVDYIVSHESGWNVTAENPSGAYGLCQALPGSKMASAGSDWATNPVTQLQWCNSYAVGRYGSWYEAYTTWLSQHWW